jgi:hypothetical protein
MFYFGMNRGGDSGELGEAAIEISSGGFLTINLGRRNAKLTQHLLDVRFQHQDLVVLVYRHLKLRPRQQRFDYNLHLTHLRSFFLSNSLLCFSQSKNSFFFALNFHFVIFTTCTFPFPQTPASLRHREHFF